MDLYSVTSAIMEYHCIHGSDGKVSFSTPIKELSVNSNHNKIFKTLTAKHVEYEMNLGYAGTEANEWIVIVEIKRIEEPTTGKSWQWTWSHQGEKEEAIRHACDEVDTALTDSIIR